MNQDYVQTMPNNEFMVKAEMTIQDSIKYYKNWWTRLLTSFLIDVEFDKALLQEDPDAIVADHNDEPMPAKLRLEHRKMNVDRAIRMLAAIKKLESVPKEEFESTFLSDEALKVSETVVAEKTENNEDQANQINTNKEIKE